MPKPKPKHDIKNITSAFEGMRDEAIAELDNEVRVACSFAKKALDFEYEAFTDCKVLGPIADELYPEEDTVDWPDIEPPPVAAVHEP